MRASAAYQNTKSAYVRPLLSMNVQEWQQETAPGQVKEACVPDYPQRFLQWACGRPPSAPVSSYFIMQRLLWQINPSRITAHFLLFRGKYKDEALKAHHCGFLWINVGMNPYIFLLLRLYKYVVTGNYNPWS